VKGVRGVRPKAEALILEPGLVADAELAGLDRDRDDRDSSELGSRI
jgi:hypothetical protein